MDKPMASTPSSAGRQIWTGLGLPVLPAMQGSTGRGYGMFPPPATPGPNIKSRALSQTPEAPPFQATTPQPWRW